MDNYCEDCRAGNHGWCKDPACTCKCSRDGASDGGRLG